MTYKQLLSFLSPVAVVLVIVGVSHLFGDQTQSYYGYFLFVYGLTFGIAIGLLATKLTLRLFSHKKTRP